MLKWQGSEQKVLVRNLTLARVSMHRGAAFNASCDCVDLRAARSADGPGGGYALLATPPLSGLNASFDLSL